MNKEMAVHLEELQTRVLMGELTNLEDVVFLLQELEYQREHIEYLGNGVSSMTANEEKLRAKLSITVEVMEKLSTGKWPDEYAPAEIRHYVNEVLSKLGASEG